MRIELTIERLVLHDVAPGDADLVRRALEASLAETLASVDPGRLRSGAVDSVRAALPPLRHPGPAGPTGLGAGLGTALATVVQDGGR
ncbi:hypothetical protein [Intrasporangium sp.]|uniref:hypothetical protein n=1 Tax=Intrasporangium sp. TaxID=1925024 RepID=UPI00322171E5